MRINEQGRLVVNFRTKARFRGLFVESHSGGTIKTAGECYFSPITQQLCTDTGVMCVKDNTLCLNQSSVVNFSYLATSTASMVMSVDHPGLTFNLTLLRSEPTYNQPVQQWTFTSDFAVSKTA